MENKKTKLIAEDANFFKDMEGKCVSNEEKEFFERMKFKIENMGFEFTTYNEI